MGRLAMNARCCGRSPTHATRYRAAGARVVVIDDAGHSVNVQRPAEVAELIRDFAGHRTPG
jgi:pimeloyl-ACP methyl ester carboxylesterase